MIPSRSVGLGVQEVLYWAGPVAVALYHITARTIAFCMLQKPAKKGESKLQRRITITLCAAVLSLYVAQGLVYLIQFLQEPTFGQTGGASHKTVYLLSSSLLWIVLLVGLLPSKPRVWYPYVGAWGISCIIDSVILILTRRVHPKSSFGSAQDLLQLARVCCHLLLICSTLAFYASRHTTEELQDTEPLLSPTDGTNGRHTYNSLSSSDNDDDDEDGGSDDEDEPERIKELRKKQKQHLAERGSWIAYLKDFKVLLPLIVPSLKERFVIACTALLVTILLADRALNVLVPRQMGILVNELTKSAGTGVLPYHELGLWVLFVWLRSRAGLDMISQFAQLPLEQYAYRKIGTTAFRHIMTLSMDFHNDKNSGELIAAVGQGQNLYRLIDFMVMNVGPMICDLVVAFIYVSILFDSNMAMILLFVGLSYTYLGTWIAVWTVKRRRRFNKAWRTESKTQNEAIHNWQTVSHFNRAYYECDRYTNTVDEYNAAERSYYYLQYFGGSAQSLILLVGRVSAGLLAARRVSQGLAPVGSFVTLLSYWSTIEGPLAGVSYSVRQLSQILTDSERLMELLNTKPTVRENPDSPPLNITRGKVEFCDVDFSYDPRKSTLKDISFVAEAGTTVALVGETGGGKTTILKLLYRYYDTVKGSIQIDGQDLRNVSLDSLRDSFGMVPQDPALFNMSIMENVRYARLDATDTEVYEACQAAAIHDKIMTFPDGYRSKVGERGVKLSGGELQRVAIARAILRNPAIVLLDEATSMIDAETEHLIQRAFRKLTSGRTTFVVAHRLSTIQHADQILVVSNGEIIERGTHAELIALGGKYVGLWSRQLSKQPDAVEKVED